MFVDKNGKKYKKAFVDGYAIGDRLLEGVMFEATINKNDEFEVKIFDRDKEYFEQLNKKYWLEEIKNLIKEGEGETTADIEGKIDVWIENLKKKKIPIQKINTNTKIFLYKEILFLEEL